MALDFGWKANEVRESIWRGDPALGDIPAAAMEAWREDGDASHFEPYCLHGQPTRITYRSLTTDETRVIASFYSDASSSSEAFSRAVLMCFRLAVNFVGKEDQMMPDGSKRSIIVKERGLRMLAEPFVAFIEQSYPGIVGFYGGLVLSGSFATEKEKKASSPPSTQTPSPAAVSTEAITAPSPDVAAA